MRFAGIAALAGVATAAWFQSPKAAEAQQAKAAFSSSAFNSYKLVDMRTESHDSKVLTFALPEKDIPLNFKTPSCITLRYADAKGTSVERPYTPLNLESDKGTFELVVKCYPGSKMGTHLFNMKKGDSIQAMGPWQTMEMTPSRFAHIGMLIGGTGITPAYQVAHNFLSNPASQTKFSLLYSNKTKDDILLGDRLDAMTREHPNRFAVFYALSQAPPRWNGYTGHINKETIAKTMPKPSSKGDSIILVSGPPPFMKTISGEKQGRNQGPLGGYLKEMGYTEQMVHKF